MGHVYRGLMIAQELINHEIIFVCMETDTLAIDYIRNFNYKIALAKSRKNFSKKIIELKPHLVINDILDTDAEYIIQLKKQDIRVINFEDLGNGAEVADLVFNALYPHMIPKEHIMVGPTWFCLRDEFIHIKKKDRNKQINKILITFGGVDEGNLTCRILKLLNPIAFKNNIAIDVILGPGYIHHDELNRLIESLTIQNLDVIKTTKRISDFMNHADLAITSAGRTVFELASLHVPSIVLSQNHRETTHTFASSRNGFINLGLRNRVHDNQITETLSRVINDSALREDMVKKMIKLDLRYGRTRVINKINSILNGEDNETNYGE